ncbi:AMIN-like domain-containing (lipo)protein [Streptomyces avermitilis]
MRRLGPTLAALMLAGAGISGAVMGTAQADTAASAVCETGWESTEKHVQPTDGYKPPLTDIRTGGHECFDRMVLDFKGGSAAGALGYRVKYVDKLTVPDSPEIPVADGADPADLRGP